MTVSSTIAPTPRAAEPLEAPKNALEAPKNALEAPKNALEAPKNALEAPKNAVVPDPTLGTLSVLIPIMNEISTLPELLERVQAVPVQKEILIVDDGSTDGTREWLREHIDGKLEGVRIFYHDRNRGKGAAIRTAIPHATGDVSIVQDGDMEYVPDDFVAILTAFRDQSATVVYGSRFLHGWPPMRLPNRMVNRLLAWMVRFLFRMPLTDEATCYKAFRTPVLQSLPLHCTRFEFCPEVTAKVIRRGHRIVEVPIRYAARSMAEGKKIRWTDGVSAIWTLLKFRFVRF